MFIIAAILLVSQAVASEHCQPGYYRDLNSTCHLCPKGTFSNIHNAVACRECPRNQYSSEEGVAQCMSCPHTTYTVSEGASSLQECLGPVIELCSEEGFVGDCYKFHDDSKLVDVTIRSLRVIRGEFKVYEEADFSGSFIPLTEGFEAHKRSDYADLSSIGSFSVVINNVFCSIGNGANFRGHITKSGVECLNWNQTPLANDAKPNNFCQNPKGLSSRPYCFISESVKVDCDHIPTCVWDTECYTGTGEGYRGAVRRTAGGRDCQNWNSDFPHPHGFHSDKYSWAGVGSHNFCRSPDRGGRPWCYSTNLFTRWDHCDILKCNRQDFPFYKFDEE